MISPAELLSLLRNPRKLQGFCTDDDDLLVLSKHAVPIEALRRYLFRMYPELSGPYHNDDYEDMWDWFLNDREHPSRTTRLGTGSPWVYLLKRHKIEVSDNYVLATHFDRERLVVTRYNVARPDLEPGRTYKRAFSCKGRDFLLLWEAVAKPDRSGARTESQGLQAIIAFFRLPNVQRLWRKHIERPDFRIPEDCK